MDDQKPVLAYETPVPKPYSDNARLLVAWLGLLASIAVSLALFNAMLDRSDYQSLLWMLTLAWLGMMMLIFLFYKPRANAWLYYVSFALLSCTLMVCNVKLSQT